MLGTHDDSPHRNWPPGIPPLRTPRTRDRGPRNLPPSRDALAGAAGLAGKLHRTCKVSAKINGDLCISDTIEGRLPPLAMTNGTICSSVAVSNEPWQVAAVR